MALIHFLNGVSFEIQSNEPEAAKELLLSDKQYLDIKGQAVSLGLIMEVVPNRDESCIAVILGRNIAPSYRSIFQGRTFAGDPVKYPLPDEFQSLVLQLKRLIEIHTPINYQDTGIILSQYD